MQYQKRPQPNNSSKKRLICNWCGRKGYTEEKCFEKHGYPSGWKSNRNKDTGFCRRNISSANHAQGAVSDQGYIAADVPQLPLTPE